MDIKEKIVRLYDRLFSGDRITRDMACDEAMQLLEEIDDERQKNEVRRVVVLHLIDAERYANALLCIEGMIKSTEYYYKILGYRAYIEYCKKTDISKLEEGLQSAVDCARQEGNKMDIAFGIYEYAKYKYLDGRYDECIKDLGNVIVLAEELHNTRIELDAKYYTALALDKKGEKYMALELLRDISNKAYEAHSQGTAMFSEIKRASILKEVGRADEALEIIGQWCDNFETQI